MSDGRSRLIGIAAGVRRLTWSGRALVLEAFVGMFIVRMLLKAVSFQRLQRVLDRLTTGKTPAQDVDPARVLELAHFVNAASRHTPVDNTCLHRSVTLWWLLRRRAIDGRLRLGARKRNGEREAHAWVEYRGEIVSEDSTRAEDYVPLPWMPAGRDA